MNKKLKSIVLASALTLSVAVTPAFVQADSTSYTVVSGDSLFKIAQKYNTTVGQLVEDNNLKSSEIHVGQQLQIDDNSNKYKVKSGDTLYLLSKRFGTTIQDLKVTNGLASDTLNIGQSLTIPFAASKDGSIVDSATTKKPTQTSTTTKSSYKKVGENSKLTKYIVREGDTASSISKKFGSKYSPEKIVKFNYMTMNDWFDAGETIWVDGYAPRNYDVVPGEASGPSQYGTAIDWFKDGQYILKRNEIIRITDTWTGKQFTVKIMGGYNHADVEPITSYDTSVMKSIFKTWKWAPRPVSVHVDGMNIAASLSGMPHSFDTISDNEASGHFDLYVSNSKPHNEKTDTNYVKQHHNNIAISSGK
ncbi:LysM repeat protein [Lysinibacillus composti]|uniref:LysM peptidoglycan-binding domain-containing protein n=1 Tax=Lysinibacillus composti TaxID=720633 RepID=A0A3N9UT96_9BACI|nr:LysM peptidoglycan-binding domain-containing protein [Lysinibacillus composti]MBM7607777.1 LysM repeat protein [Lysinibacillus composti]RQW75732.1 LysM peptidoglycan-binding domain-containing protein [Lysinibacillus composti]